MEIREEISTILIFLSCRFQNHFRRLTEILSQLYNSFNIDFIIISNTFSDLATASSSNYSGDKLLSDISNKFIESILSSDNLTTMLVSGTANFLAKSSNLDNFNSYNILSISTALFIIIYNLSVYEALF